MSIVSGRHDKSVAAVNSPRSKHEQTPVSRPEAKALLTQLVDNRVALRDARQRLDVLEGDHPKRMYQAEDVGTAFELKAKIRQCQAKDDTLTNELKSKGLKDPRDATSFYVALVPSIDFRGVASVRFMLGYESYVDRDTGQRIRGPFVGNVNDTLFGELGYGGSKRDHGLIWSASPIPYFEVGEHPVYGTTVEVEVHGVASLGVGSEGFIEGGVCFARAGLFGLGVEGCVGDPRLAKVTAPVAQKAERSKEKILHPRQKLERPVPSGAPKVPRGRHRAE